MPLTVEPFADWLRRIDAHAGHRLPLLKRAQRILAGQEAATAEDRRKLASALERCRYQHLVERRSHFTLADQRLSEMLDLVGGALAGQRLRPARAPRKAIRPQDGDPSPLAAALRGLDPGVPLEELAGQARAITERHFSLTEPGPAAATRRRRMLLYAPLYLSSHCINYCVYCGFRYPLAIERRHLTLAEALSQADILQGRGLRHILLVAGDFPRLTSTEYFGPILRAMVERGVVPSVEIAPQSTAAYAELARAGALGVTLYQETYDENLYALYHPRGTKASYDWRLEGLERAAEAGMKRLGLGVLLGLCDPRKDLRALLRHGRYLESRFPQCTLAFSLPRIYDAPPDFQVPYPVDDETFVRLYCVLRLAFPQAELVLSTREPPELRGRLAGICITQMSAGSSTVPGGYENGGAAESCAQQFPVSDHRGPAEVAAWLRSAGIEPVWESCPQGAR